MRRPSLFLAIIGASLALLLAACGGDDDDASRGSGIKVVATTTQIGALTKAVAGEAIQLEVLLEAGASAHDYEPDPSALKKISEAKLVLKNGIGLDDWLDKSIESAGGSSSVVLATEGIEPVARDDGEDDPHVWHDTDNAKRMVENIVAALSKADPANADTFRKNGDAYKATLDETDKQVKALIDAIPAANRKVVTNHDAFGYFLDRYGLVFVGAVIPSTSSEAQPSAKELAELQDLIKKEGVKAIFAEDEIDPKVAREISKDTGVKIVDDLIADSLGAPGSGADTVHGMLLSNAKKIAEALK